MQTISGNIVFPKNSTIDHKIPKSIISFFVSVQIITGIDVGFRKYLKKRISTILNCYSVILSVVISGILLATAVRSTGQDFSWFWGCTIKFILYALTFRLIKYKIYEFIKDIHDFHEKISLLESGVCGIGLLIYVFSILCGRQLFVIIRCRLNNKEYCEGLPEIYHIFFSYGIQASDIVGSFPILIILYVFALINHMKKALEVNKDLKSLEQHYVFLVNCFDKVKRFYNQIMIVELCINTPRIMATLWFMMKYIKESAEWFTYTSEWLFAFHLIIQMCIPAAIAEMANKEADSIKLILNELRNKEKDQEKLYQITKVLRYIKHRKLLTDVWSVIPLDLRLPLALLSFCTTYFIVILQFTHLYD